MSARILIIDDEEAIRFSLRGILEDEGYEIIEASTGEDGLRQLSSDTPDVVFLDIWMPGMDGLAVLDHIHTATPSLPVIMISGHGTIETAVCAIKKGAHDFIEKPLSLEKALLAVERALEVRDLKRENEALRSAIPSASRANELIGVTPPVLQIRNQISRVAPTDAWVLITGENGTGKELVARAIHNGSQRASRPLVAVNCAAIPEELIESELFGHEKGAFTGAESAKTGKFEMADKGTLFLDEIADMSLKTQAKILRILQEQSFERVGGNRTIRVDVRVVAATNKNLEAAIAHGEFREDLYYRLRVFPLQLPPLRERSGDIPELLEFFMEQLCQEQRFTPIRFDAEALETLCAYRWPGNVRELRNFVERMLILHMGTTVHRHDLPPEFLRKASVIPTNTASEPEAHPVPKQDELVQPESIADFKAARNAFEAKFLAMRLQECGGNVSKLAELVGLERSHLYRKLKGYQIQVSE